MFILLLLFLIIISDTVINIYYNKARVKWNGGEWANKDNWTLMYIEEYKPVTSN